MARQAATTRKRSGSKAAVAKPAAVKTVRTRPGTPRVPQLEGLGPEQKIANLLADREKLVARIAMLESEVSTLKATQSEVADRIAWTLDSLKDLIGQKG